MIKVMICDDEKLIREGLRDQINWTLLGMTVVAIAKDGEEALLLAKETQPDICLVDICMPFITGLDLIEQLSNINDSINFIIITGYDDFNYAQTALKLHVFDYVLKPIDKANLVEILIKLGIQIIAKNEQAMRVAFLQKESEQIKPILQEKFLLKCLKGEVDSKDIMTFEQTSQLTFGPQIGVIIIDIDSMEFINRQNMGWKRQDSVLSIKFTLSEILSSYKSYYILTDDKSNLVIIISLEQQRSVMNLNKIIEETVLKNLGYRLNTHSAEVSGGLSDLSTCYTRIQKEINNQMNRSPFVKMILKSIEKNYHDSNLSLNAIAIEVGASVSYVSKAFKSDMGIGFSEYLNRKRISEALELLKNHNLKVHEIAELTGYNSQHYFCAAFKKIMGYSPSEHK